MIYHHIECNECSYVGEYSPYPYRSRRRVYDLGPSAVVPVTERISWCYDCGRLVRVEKLISQDGISAMLADYAETVKTGGNGLRDDLEFAGEVLHSEAQWRAFATEREAGKCRCIRCGSTNIETEAEFNYFSTGKIDSFRHPGCGGKLRVIKTEDDLHISRKNFYPERLPRAIFSKNGLIKMVEERPGIADSTPEDTDTVRQAQQPEADIYLRPGAEQISRLVSRLRENNAYSLEANDELLDELARTISAWNMDARRLRVDLAEKGVRHELSETVYTGGFTILLLLISAKRFQQGSRLLEVMQASFADIPGRAGKLAEFEHITQSHHAELKETQDRIEVTEQKKQDDRQISEPFNSVADARKKVLVLEISAGIFWKDKFRLYSTEIEWKDQRIALDDIQWIIWGGVPTFDKKGSVIKMDTHIRVGNAERSLDIQGFSGSKAGKVIDSLRQPLMSRLMWVMITEIKSGKLLPFGDARVNDLGVYLTRREQFGALPVHCVWADINVAYQNGDLHISSKSDPRTYVNIPFIRIKNAHLLETAVVHALKKGMQKISDLLLAS
ncbi:hypothetical protein ACO0LO_20660 [Undibacterium sp. TJN25]|uniref:hypothetical protein n=1 Tax=Undibacterium sp. TJN25 TaxID=3413056 RepID=UPI003BEF6FA8